MTETASRLEANPGGRPLLLVHGFTGAKEDFADVVERLAERGWHVVAPDLRGHGSAPHPAGRDAYSFATFVDDLVRLADAMGWGRFAVLGHSMGGMLAQHLVLRDPARVDALVLMDTSHGVPPGIDADLIALGMKVVEDGGIPALVAFQRGMEAPLDTPAHLRLIAEKPGYAEFCEGKQLACSDDMWLAMIPQLLGQDDRLDALRAVAVPTLVVVGEQDEPFLDHSRAMAAAIPDARLAVIPDAGHSPQFENFDVWWRELAAFLDSLPAAR